MALQGLDTTQRSVWKCQPKISAKHLDCAASWHASAEECCSRRNQLSSLIFSDPRKPLKLRRSAQNPSFKKQKPLPIPLRSLDLAIWQVYCWPCPQALDASDENESTQNDVEHNFFVACYTDAFCHSNLNLFTCRQMDTL